MPDENLIIEAFREMKTYYGNSYNRITELFSGFLHSSIKCPDQHCGFSSSKFDAYLLLSLPMPERPTILGKPLTIYECMQEYCKEEVLDQDNLWACEGCNKKVKAIKKLQLWTAPPILVVHLKRFANTRTSKDRRMVVYPTNNFDISSMISSVQYDTSKCYKYTLQCIINHSGGLHGGHYISYCKDDDTGRWFNFDDTMVSEISPAAVVTQNAYFLFYTRQDMLNVNA